MKIGDVSWGKLLANNKSDLSSAMLDFGNDVRWGRLFVKHHDENDTISGNVVSFVSRKSLPLKSCVVQIKSIRDGAGTPSPENIRKVSGWTGLGLRVSPTTEAKDGGIVTVDWSDEAGTVYGGTLDVLAGTLTVDRIGRVFVGTESWAKSGSGDSSFFRYTDSRATSDAGAVRASSHFPNATVLSSTTAVGYYAYTSGSQQTTRIQIRPRLDGVTTAEEWKAWLAEQAANGTPLTCWWQINTQIVYQLGSTQVMTLAGQNHIWADCGEITVQVDKSTTKRKGVGAVAGIAIVGTADLRSGNDFPEAALVGSAIAGSTAVGEDGHDTVGAETVG